MKNNNITINLKINISVWELMEQIIHFLMFRKIYNFLILFFIIKLKLVIIILDTTKSSVALVPTVQCYFIVRDNGIYYLLLCLFMVN